MLRLVVVTSENFDEATSTIVPADSFVMELEHSLVSLSKWESRWEIPFIDTEDKTDEQVLDYIRCMFLGEEFPEKALEFLTKEQYEQIRAHIDAKMTATTFRESKNQSNGEMVTAELIYYWMIALTIPFECENWHLNRLLTLVRVCNIKNTPPDKKSRRESNAERKALNAQRRAQFGTRG